MAEQLRQVPGAVDVTCSRSTTSHAFHIGIERSQAEKLGITARDIATSVLVSLSGSFQTSPTFFLNPQNGVSYNIAIQAPQYNIGSLQDLENLPIHGMNSSQILSNLASVERYAEPGTIYHYDIRSVIDVYANVQDRDLGAVSREVNKIVAEARKKRPLAARTSPCEARS